MGKYVDAAQRRSRRTMTRMMTSHTQGACPFSGAVNTDDAVCVLDALMSDPRVSTELAVNLVMALFRTGIDSVSSASFIVIFQLPRMFSNPDGILYQAPDSIVKLC